MKLINTSLLPAISALGLGLIALMWAVIGLSQPLWVDELHSSWVIADSWSDILQRSRQGNQTPMYFACLKGLISIFGTQTELLIRLPSLLAWSLAVGSLAWMLLRRQAQLLNSDSSHLNSVIGTAAVVLWCSCVLLDAWQYFYAIEARVYAVVQLLNIWAWFAVMQITTSYKQANSWWWLVWSGLVGALLHLHITSGLAVIFQGIVLAVVVFWTRRDLAYLLTSLTFIGLNAIWLCYDSQAIWQRRQQWTSFAGDGSFASLTNVFPFVPLLVPVGVGWLLVRCLAWRSSRNASSLRLNVNTLPQVQLTNYFHIYLWGVAALGPYLLAWLLTRYNIAPMFHYRFVIVAALPLYLFSGCWWLLQPNLAIRCLTAVAVFCWMNFSSGPLAPGQQGRWHKERQEDWRSASEFVEQHFHSSSQSLWCYAGLIEGTGLSLPIADSVDEYLSYPLRGDYRISSDGRAVIPHGLVADRKLWLEQIRQARKWTSLPSDNPAGTTTEVWIIYRGVAERLWSDLGSANMQKFPKLVPICRFGRISVVCIKID